MDKLRPPKHCSTNHLQTATNHLQTATNHLQTATNHLQTTLPLTYVLQPYTNLVWMCEVAADVSAATLIRH